MEVLQETKTSNSSSSCSTAIDVKSKIKPEKARESWDNKIEYLLSSIGYAVGLGNVWRFPYLAYKHGGGAFLLPYILVLFICGLPIFLLETSIGQFASQGPTRAFNSIPLLKGIGFAMVNVSLFVAPYYNIILSWTIYYLGNALKSVFTGDPLAWTECPSDVLNCYTREKQDICNKMNKNDTDFSLNCPNWSTKQVASEVFWDKNVHNMKEIDGIEKAIENGKKSISYDPSDLGTVNWHLVVTLAISWVIIGTSIIRGVKSSGKTMYVTATLPYVILFGLLMKGLTLDGCLDGIIFFVKPNLSALADPIVWKAAITQIFYSLSVCWGGILTLSSYTPFRNDLYKDSYFIVCMNSGTSIFAGFAIFSYLGFMAKHLGVNIDDIVASGPGLAFIVWPEAITLISSSVRLCALFGVLFFVMLYSLGVSTMIVTVETLVTSTIDIYPRLRRYRWKVVVFVACVLFCVGIPLVTQNGIWWFQLFDDYSASYSLILLAVIEMLAMSHVYGVNRVANDIKMMTGKTLPTIFRICWPYLTPTILIGTFVGAMAMFEHTNKDIHGVKIYTTNNTIIFGAFLSLSPIILLIGLATRELMKHDWNFAKSVKPTRHWGPYNDTDRLNYAEEREDNVVYQPHEELDTCKSLKLGDEMITRESYQKA